MPVQPYVFFDGRCDEAIAFYREALDAQLEARLQGKSAAEINSNQEGCGPMIPPGGAHKVMHASLRIGDSSILMSDGQNYSGQPKFEGFALTISATDERHARRLFDGVAAGGQVQMPLGKTFFSPAFGMAADKFGVMWMVLVPQAP
jgi:PhnB protein